MMSLAVKSKTGDLVRCEVIDGGELKSIRHLNVRGKSATLPSITEKDWEDIKFGVENQVDFYAISFVKDADVENQLLSFMIIAFSILRPLLNRNTEVCSEEHWLSRKIDKFIPRYCC
nr:Pyruvate kinase [Ipomoea batatas]